MHRCCTTSPLVAKHRTKLVAGGGNKAQQEPWKWCTTWSEMYDAPSSCCLTPDETGPIINWKRAQWTPWRSTYHQPRVEEEDISPLSVAAAWNLRWGTTRNQMVKSSLELVWTAWLIFSYTGFTEQHRMCRVDDTFDAFVWSIRSIVSRRQEVKERTKESKHFSQ